MRSLYLRIYITLVAVLGLFALASGWLVQRHLEEQRGRAEMATSERLEALGDLLQRSLPGADAPASVQGAALREWSQRLRVPLALDNAAGQRLAMSDSFVRRDLANPALADRSQAVRLDDGRTLWVARPGARNPPGRAGGKGLTADLSLPWLPPRLLPDGVGMLLLLLVIFIAVAAGAWPVVRRLTRRLEALKQGVEAFGAGALHQRVAEDGRDEVAAVGSSFNRAASRIEALLRSHQSLLANASHELRSPLARLKMATSMLADDTDVPIAQRLKLKTEIDTNIAELDALVEEVLLASRLDANAALDRHERVAMLALAAEEGARFGAQVSAQMSAQESAQERTQTGSQDLYVNGDERLLRRAVRNLLENARRYGGDTVDVQVVALEGPAPVWVELSVQDRGPGVPEAQRERIFEAFYRLPGHAEHAGGVGLGLALVRQIAERHGGSVRCEARDGGGSRFVLRLPAAG